MNPEITPLELLEDHLNGLEKALKKSTEAFNMDMIPENIHHTHVANLTPKIQAYKLAIRVLNTYL